MRLVRRRIVLLLVVHPAPKSSNRGGGFGAGVKTVAVGNVPCQAKQVFCASWPEKGAVIQAGDNDLSANFTLKPVGRWSGRVVRIRRAVKTQTRLITVG